MHPRPPSAAYGVAIQLDELDDDEFIAELLKEPGSRGSSHNSMMQSGALQSSFSQAAEERKSESTTKGGGDESPRKDDPRIKNVIVNIKRELFRMKVENKIEDMEHASHPLLP